MQEIEIPAAKNQRADEMWRIIEQSAEFEGKTVLDLGCGHGDMLWRAGAAGAKDVLGVDSDERICLDLRESSADVDNFSVLQYDINRLDSFLHSDIIFCFSVLPYLIDPDNTLHWIRGHSDMAFLEIQYAGDGPGFDHIHNDDDMRLWLEKIGCQKIEAIGRTHTRIRPAWRTIWKCSNA